MATRNRSVTVDTHTVRSAHGSLDGGVSADLADLYMFVVYKQNSHGGRGEVRSTGWLETATLGQVLHIACDE